MLSNISIFNKRYDNLLIKYQTSWDEDLSYNPCDKLLKLLRLYTEGWNSTHAKQIKLIIQPYIDDCDLYCKTFSYSELFNLLYQIRESIPKETINLQGSLAAIFAVFKNNTKIDLFSFYENKNLSTAFLNQKCMNKVMLFLCAANGNNLHKDVTLYICMLLVKSMHDEKNNYPYHVLMNLLDGYCGFNLSVPENYERSYLNEIKKLRTYYFGNDHLPGGLADGYIYQNIAGLLFQLSIRIPLETVSDNDGLHYIFKILNQHFGIDISDFYLGSPCSDFYNKNIGIILKCFTYNCWIKMILDRASSFTIDDAKLLLSRPYFFSTKKSDLINCLISSLERYGNRLDCIHFIISTDNELSDAFFTAISISDYIAAIHLFRYAHQLSPETTEYIYIRRNNMSSYLDDIDTYAKEECRDVLQELLTNHISTQIDSSFLVLLLDRVLLLDNIDENYDDTNYSKTIQIYHLLIEKKHLIPDWDTVVSKFKKCFIDDMNHFFHELFYDYSLNYPIFKDLLQSNNPDINILKPCLIKGYILETNHNFFYYAPDFSLRYNQSNDRRIRPLHAVICLIIQDDFIPENTLNLIKLFVHYDKRCLFQKDYYDRNILLPLRSINIDKRSDVSDEDKITFREIYQFIKDAFYSYQNVITFFAGTKKYDLDSTSIISQLPHEVAQKITSLTMKLNF